MIRLILIAFLLTGCADLDEILRGPDFPNQNPDFSNIKIGSFNVQIFGRSYMEDPQRVLYLRETIKRYDIMLLQEIRDSSGESIITLKAPLSNYQMVISDRLGRTSSKEQYAFFYNSNKIQLLGCYQYPDPDDDFEREPYACRFLDLKSEQEFNLIALHTKPTDAKNELIEAELVFNQINIELGSPSALIGDLNADCSYLSDADFNDLLFSLYTWLIPRTADTTTTSTNCAYDNIIVDSGLENLTKDAGVFDFQEAFNLSNDLTLDISDHYPVEFTLELE